MIKNIILHLEPDPVRDLVRDFAASAAGMFDAHLTGVSFAFAATIPSYIAPTMPPATFAHLFPKEKQPRAMQLTALKSL